MRERAEQSVLRQDSELPGWHFVVCRMLTTSFSNTREGTMETRFSSAITEVATEAVNFPCPLPPQIFATVACELEVTSGSTIMAPGTRDLPWEEGGSKPWLVLVMPKVCCFAFSSVRQFCSCLQSQSQHKVVALPHFFPQNPPKNN